MSFILFYWMSFNTNLYLTDEKNEVLRASDLQLMGGRIWTQIIIWFLMISKHNFFSWYRNRTVYINQLTPSHMLSFNIDKLRENRIFTLINISEIIMKKIEKQCNPLSEFHTDMEGQILKKRVILRVKLWTKNIDS